MSNARLLLEEELRSVSGAPERCELASLPPHCNVIAPPEPGSRLEQAYKLLEVEKCTVINELGQAHLACMISEAEEVLNAVEAAHRTAAEGAVEHSEPTYEQEHTQNLLHQEWNAEIRAIVDRKLNITS